MKIAVYCSAKDTIAQDYKVLGERIGLWLAEHSHTLIFGGATGGLMTAVSKAAFENGGEVVGIIPPTIARAGRLSPYCTQLISVANMNERKQQMKELADCFVCLPGSYGTLDEMFDVIASGTVGEHRKPLYILNVEGFYNSLCHQIERMKQEVFIPKLEAYHPDFVSTLDELTEQLNVYEQKLLRRQQ